MTDTDLVLIQAAIKAQRPVHWSMASVLVTEIVRLRTELVEAHAMIREQVHEEQEVP